MKRVLGVKAENCTGCRMCELACSSAKEGVFIPERARVRVVADAFEGHSRPAICLQCQDPMCMAVCPVDAIAKNETDAGDVYVAVDSDKCIGCRRCTAACPFGAMGFYADTKAVKCDLCGGAPKCVEFCFYDCLVFEPLSDEMYARRVKKVSVVTHRVCKEISGKERRARQAACPQAVSKVLWPATGGPDSV